MAFPSQGGSVKSLAEVWLLVRGVARHVKTQAQSVRSASAGGPISALKILELLGVLAAAKADFTAAAQVTGLAAYAQEQVGNPSLDVAAEFTAMQAQINATISWAVANMPNDGTYLAAVTLGADGNYAWRMFSTAALATFRTQLDALIATID